MPLGDAVSKALAAVGVTEERVSTWLGRPCSCRQRRLKLNQLDMWARRVVRGAFTDVEAANRLNQLADEELAKVSGDKT